MRGVSKLNLQFVLLVLKCVRIVLDLGILFWNLLPFLELRCNRDLLKLRKRWFLCLLRAGLNYSRLKEFSYASWNIVWAYKVIIIILFRVLWSFRNRCLYILLDLNGTVPRFYLLSAFLDEKHQTTLDILCALVAKQ